MTDKPTPRHLRKKYPGYHAGASATERLRQETRNDLTRTKGQGETKKEDRKYNRKLNKLLRKRPKPQVGPPISDMIARKRNARIKRV